MENSNGFTLAEVLITLGIIGIIAALTIPTLIQKQTELTTVGALKKEYSTLSQALESAIAEKGTVENWGLGTVDVNGKEVIDILASYLKITKNCGYDTNCVPDSYVFGDTTRDYNTGYAKAQLADGSILIVNSMNPSCNGSAGSANNVLNGSVCGDIYIDINGFAPPNKVDYDLFSFYLTQKSLIPRGSELSDDPASIRCEFNPGFCAAWVISNGNMDYPAKPAPPRGR